MSNRDEQEKRNATARRKAEQYIADFQWMMDNPRGRRLMHAWLKKSGLYEKSYTGNSETYYREGRRSFGIDLLQDVNTLSPDKYVTMLEEQRNDRTDDRTE